jgi:hypothetical protein
MLLVSWIITSVVSTVVTVLLRAISFDRLSTRIGLTRLEQQMTVHMDSAILTQSDSKQHEECGPAEDG